MSTYARVAWVGPDLIARSFDLNQMDLLPDQVCEPPSERLRERRAIAGASGWSAGAAGLWLIFGSESLRTGAFAVDQGAEDQDMPARRQTAVVAQLMSPGWTSAQEVVGVSPWIRNSAHVLGVIDQWHSACATSTDGSEEPMPIHLIGLGEGADRLVEALDRHAREHLRDPNGPARFEQIVLVGSSAPSDSFRSSGQVPGAGALIARLARRVLVLAARDDLRAQYLARRLDSGQRPLCLCGAEAPDVGNVENLDLSGKLGAHDELISALLCQYDLLALLRRRLLLQE